MALEIFVDGCGEFSSHGADKDLGPIRALFLYKPKGGYHPQMGWQGIITLLAMGQLLANSLAWGMGRLGRSLSYAPKRRHAAAID